VRSITKFPFGNSRLALTAYSILAEKSQPTGEQGDLLPCSADLILCSAV